MEKLKTKLRQMALTPKVQIRRLLVGTVGALTSMLVLLFTSQQENTITFYSFSLILILFVLYAAPGYIGIWMWRMRRFFFDLD